MPNKKISITIDLDIGTLRRASGVLLNALIARGITIDINAAFDIATKVLKGIVKDVPNEELHQGRGDL